MHSVFPKTLLSVKHKALGTKGHLYAPGEYSDKFNCSVMVSCQSGDQNGGVVLCATQ